MAVFDHAPCHDEWSGMGLQPSPAAGGGSKYRCAGTPADIAKRLCCFVTLLAPSHGGTFRIHSV